MAGKSKCGDTFLSSLCSLAASAVPVFITFRFPCDENTDLQCGVGARKKDRQRRCRVRSLTPHTTDSRKKKRKNLKCDLSLAPAAKNDHLCHIKSRVPFGEIVPQNVTKPLVRMRSAV